MNTKLLVAIDIGSTKVACVVGKPREMAAASCSQGKPLTNGCGSAIELSGVGVASYPTLTTTWPCEPAQLAHAMNQALDDAKLTQLPDRAVVTLTHPALAHRRVTAHIELADEPVMIRRRDLQRLQAQAISQVLELDREVLLLEPLGYAGNGFEAVSDPCGLAATRLRGAFQLISIPLAVRRTVVHALDIVGLELDRMVYGLQAMAVACVEERLRSKRILLMDVGGCCTDLAILDAGRLSKTHSVPWGGAMVVEAMAKECRMTMEQALPASLEGLTSQDSRVPALIEQQLRSLRQSLHDLLNGEALPDLAIVTGRGALMDGLVEWVSQISQVKAVLGRSPHAKGLGDLKRQITLTPALGLLELALQTSPAGGLAHVNGIRGSGRLLERLLERTRQILVEYF